MNEWMPVVNSDYFIIIIIIVWRMGKRIICLLSSPLSQRERMRFTDRRVRSHFFTHSFRRST